MATIWWPYSGTDNTDKRIFRTNKPTMARSAQSVRLKLLKGGVLNIFKSFLFQLFCHTLFVQQCRNAPLGAYSLYCFTNFGPAQEGGERKRNFSNEWVGSK